MTSQSSTPRIHFAAKGVARPASAGTIFCDGSADDSYRNGTDVELSHWMPNRTPPRFRADTSTEICMRFVEDPEPGPWEQVVNNHTDTDGILSVFTIVEPQVALAHRETIVQAASMGDFSAWGDEPAQALYQGLTLLMDQCSAEDRSGQETYERCIARARDVVSGDAPRSPEVEAGIAALRVSVEWVESGVIERVVVTDRLSRYVVPRALADSDLAAALRVPPFNAALSSASLLLPHARARFDRERVHLVSVESADGWFHDLHYPGYMWADTENSWRAPGFVFADSTNAYYYGHPPLDAAINILRTRERGLGEWVVAKGLKPFQAVPGRGFPVVASFMADAEPVPSTLTPGDVSKALAAAFG